jgi:PHD/YefM family antitoxin component YafN of YafNO toxin-antitoxin module
MVIRSAAALKDDYDGMVRLSAEKQEPIFLTRNGKDEMVFMSIDLWEKQQAELKLFAELLRREQSRLAGEKTYSSLEMRKDTEALLSEG